MNEGHSKHILIKLSKRPRLHLGKKKGRQLGGNSLKEWYFSQSQVKCGRLSGCLAAKELSVAMGADV